MRLLDSRLCSVQHSPALSQVVTFHIMQLYQSLQVQLSNNKSSLDLSSIHSKGRVWFWSYDRITRLNCSGGFRIFKREADWTAGGKRSHRPQNPPLLNCSARDERNRVRKNMFLYCCFCARNSRLYVSRSRAADCPHNNRSYAGGIRYSHGNIVLASSLVSHSKTASKGIITHPNIWRALCRHHCVDDLWEAIPRYSL